MRDTPVGDLQLTRERAKVLERYSHLDLQSCLAIVVLQELAELGHSGTELTEAFDESMKVHSTAVINERIRGLQ